MKLIVKATLVLCSYFVCINAQAKEYWGAIIVDQATGITKTALNTASENEAISLALNACRKKRRALECKPVLTWANGCGVVVWSPKTKQLTRDVSQALFPNRDRRELETSTCRFSQDDPKCKVLSSVCTQFPSVNMFLSDPERKIEVLPWW